MPPIGYRQVNPDGSRNVHCYQCFEFICTASGMSHINTALCVVCQAAEEGIDLTPEQVRELRTVKKNGQVFSLADAYPAYELDPLEKMAKKPNDAALGRVGYFFRALTRNVRAAAEALKETAMPVSKQIAREKRQPRVFERPLDDPDAVEITDNKED